VDFKVELYDGSYHDVDSNEMSFKMAGILAFRNVSPNCRPVLLEPILELDVSTPDEYQGAVMGDLSSRRGQILGTEPDGRLVRVKALVPEAELDRYATTLHSITHVRGTQFHRDPRGSCPRRGAHAPAVSRRDEADGGGGVPHARIRAARPGAGHLLRLEHQRQSHGQG